MKTHTFVLKQIRLVILLTLALAFAMGLQYVYAAGNWKSPSANPPNDNVSGPLHTGTGNQAKDGGLSMKNLLVLNNVAIANDSGYLNFGTTPHGAGYGFRAKDGVMQYKDKEGKKWISFESMSSSSTTKITNNYCNVADPDKPWIRYNINCKGDPTSKFKNTISVFSLGAYSKIDNTVNYRDSQVDGGCKIAFRYDTGEFYYVKGDCSLKYVSCKVGLPAIIEDEYNSGLCGG